LKPKSEEPLSNFAFSINLRCYNKGGIFTDNPAYEINHIVSIVGWGTSPKGVKYWVIRNSWGEYWGEMGYFRVIRGVKALGLEDDVAWATPGSWTHVNFPCYEDGTNCVGKKTFSAGWCRLTLSNQP